jgi:hypothetical protein
MKTTTTSIAAAAAQEPGTHEQQGRDAYRAPRLVTLGTTVRLVQGGAGFQHWDGGRGYYR